ncbi:405_t:CDS:2 [Funneliformis mosseae]|uniref:405_t:CDS:1 n=1 Tax=Funneliformis mosseae TaxID=27381 RepID=A0A9N9BP64_FUNMO|nr:405_t:CDS:2 [Funneliformis mosseae]
MSNNLLENISENKSVSIVIIQRIQKKIDNIKDFIRFHKLRLTIEEVLEYENKQEIISNLDPSCIECYLITKQPLEAFENFWYFWIVYAIKREQFNSITIRAFEKTFTLEKNLEALGKCFELIIQSIRYQLLTQKPLETSLADLKSEFETSIKSKTNSKSNSKETSRRTSRKSSKLSKINGDTFNISTSTSVDTPLEDKSANNPNSSRKQIKWNDLLKEIKEFKKKDYEDEYIIDAYFAKAKVFERKINVIIDIGAVECIITKSFLDSVYKDIEESTNIQIISITEARTAPLGKILKVGVKIGKFEIKEDMIVTKFSKYNILLRNN